MNHRNRDRLPTTVGLRRKRPTPFASSRGIASSLSSSAAATISSTGFSKRTTSPGEIPYVSPDCGRTRYYADRFYLDAPTSLLEYQVGKTLTDSREISYCNKCGEKQEAPPLRARYDHNRNRLQPEIPPNEQHSRPPLFDRAEFINSLDLSAVIIGTYTVGDLDYLKEVFPKLFPSLSTETGNNNHDQSRSQHVPTLVLHGQKGFYLEKKEKAKIMDAVKTNIKEEPVNLRGSGSSQSSKSKSPIEQPLECKKEDDCDEPQRKSDNGNVATINREHDVNGDKSPVTKEKKHRFLMYEGAKVTLPNTPKRKRKGLKRAKREVGDVAESFAIVGRKGGIDMDTSTVVYQTPSSHSPCLQDQTKPNPIDESSSKESIPIAPTSSLLPSLRSPRHNASPPGPYNVTKDPLDPLNCDYYDSSQDNMMHPGEEEELANRGWSKIQPSPLFGGEVFLTRVFPGWIKSPEKFKGGSSVMKSVVPGEAVSTAITENVSNIGYSDDEEFAYEEKYDEMMEEKQRSMNSDLKTELGVHHPKYILLFEKSGSIVVIISTSNLTPQTASDGSWVQRFEARHESQYDEFNRSGVDLGMPSDFGTILTDFLSKESDAAANGSMLPDIFLRRYVKGLPLSGLRCRYKFEDAQVHLISTVPGHHKGSIPRKGLNSALYNYKPQITYGPQRVSFILSRLLDAYHMQLANTAKKSRRLEGPMWIPKPLWPGMERLVFQPTSLGGNWTRESLEEVVGKYIQKDNENDSIEDLLQEVDIVWPSMDFFALMKEKRNAVWELNQHTKAASIIARRTEAEMRKPTRERLHVFLSSDSFARLDRSVINRMTLFETSHPPQMPFTSSSLHFKSIYRLLDLKNNKDSQSNESKEEFFSWFMLTSACLSKGAQGKATLRRGPEERDEMSYSNFELGVLFVSRLQEYDSDRLYVYDPRRKCCRCESKDKNHKARLRSSTPNNPLFLESVRKIHLPVPFKIRATSYQDDEDYDLMSATPYFHEVTETQGNVKLTPFGQKLLQENK